MRTPPNALPELTQLLGLGLGKRGQIAKPLHLMQAGQQPTQDSFTVSSHCSQASQATLSSDFHSWEFSEGHPGSPHGVQ